MSTNKTKTNSISLAVTAVVAVLVILLLFITFSFDIKKEPLPIVIELALNESNYGNNNEGSSPIEPLPSVRSTPSQVSSEVNNITENLSKIKAPAITQDKTPAPSVSKEKAEKPAKPKPQGDSRAKSALENILGGKGSQKSSGQGNNNSGTGNVGDPKGNSDQGENIGENWKTRIPDNQSHDCPSGGVVVVDIVVNAQGQIKRATPQLSSSDCLSKTAQSLVLKYVSAYPGRENRRGSYRVTLR